MAPVQPDIKGHTIDVTSEKILVTQGNFNRFRVISCCPSKNYLSGKSQRLYYSAYIFFSLFHILYITAGDCNCTCSYDVVQLIHNFSSEKWIVIHWIPLEILRLKQLHEIINNCSLSWRWKWWIFTVTWSGGIKIFLFSPLTPTQNL